MLHLRSFACLKHPSLMCLFFFLSAALYRHIWSEAWWTSFSAAAIFWTFLCRSCSFYNVVGLTLRHTVSQFLFRSHPVVKFDILSNFANELRSVLTPETLRRKIRKVLCRNGTSRLEALVLEYAWITHDSQFTPASFRENCFVFGVNEQRKFAIAHSAQYTSTRFIASTRTNFKSHVVSFFFAFKANERSFRTVHSKLCIKMSVFR